MNYWLFKMGLGVFYPRPRLLEFFAWSFMMLALLISIANQVCNFKVSFNASYAGIADTCNFMAWRCIAGGMNGSIIYELDRPENAGLSKSVKVSTYLYLHVSFILLYMFIITEGFVTLKLVQYWQVLEKAKLEIDNIQNGMLYTLQAIRDFTIWMKCHLT